MVHKLARLNEVGRRLIHTRNPDALLDEILAAVDDVFHLTTCAVLLAEPGSGDLVIRRSRGYDPEVVASFRGRPGQGVTGWVFEHNRPILVEDVRSDPRYVAGVRDAVSEMAAPLRIDSRILGVVDAESTEAGAFDREDLEVFAAFAAQAAVCLENANLYRQLERDQEALARRARRQGTVARAMALLQGKRDLDEVLAEILELSQTALGFEACAVLLLANGSLVVEAARGYPAEIRGKAIPVGQGITGAVVQSRQPLLVPDVTADPRYIKGTIAGQCEMTVPLLVGEELLGVLDAETCRVAAHDQEDLELFAIFATHAAMAIRNARQLAALEGRERELQARVRELALLGEVGEQICSVLDLDRLLDRTLELAQRALPFQHCAVLLLDDGGQHLTVRCARGYRDEVRGLRIPLQTGVTGRVARSGEATVVGDVGANGDYIPGVEGARSEMAVPLKVQGRLLGVLDAEAVERDAFSARDLELFGAFASWVAVALHNAELYQDLERANDRLRESITEIEAMNRELTAYSERIAEANRQLERRVRELVTLHEATMTITSSLDLAQTLDTIQSLSKDIINATSSVIHLLDGESEVLTGSRGRELEVVAGSPHVLETPLRIGDRTIGVFELVAENGFSDEDRRMIQTLASQAAIAIENARLFERTQRTYYETIRSLAEALEARDPYTRGHSERVCRYAIALAEAVGLSEEDRHLIEHAALLHDIGKIGISDLILHKVGKLNQADRKTIERHPMLGDSILEPLQFLHQVQHVVRHHHERWDGAGYPEGLRGEEIPLPARTLAVADAFDAMTSTRPYRPALSRAEAIGELELMSGSQFDPGLVRVFLGLLETRWLDVGRPTAEGGLAGEPEAGQPRT